MKKKWIKVTMEGDISFEDIKQALFKHHDGYTDWLSETTLKELQYYKHCSTCMGYTAEFIAGAIATLANRNNFRIFD
jgi:hypothetical protein